MISLLKGLKKETIEELAELWEIKQFKKLVEILRINQENLGKQMLMGRITRENCDNYRELQDTAATYSLIIKIVEDAYKKVNNIKRKK
jgi:hypothetical protein